MPPPSREAGTLRGPIPKSKDPGRRDEALASRRRLASTGLFPGGGLGLGRPGEGVWDKPLPVHVLRGTGSRWPSGRTHTAGGRKAVQVSQSHRNEERPLLGCGLRAGPRVLCRNRRNGLIAGAGQRITNTKHRTKRAGQQLRSSVSAASFWLCISTRMPTSKDCSGASQR